VVGHAEVARPGKEPVDRPLGLAGRLPFRRAELTHGLQHPEPQASRGVGHLEERLVGEVLQDRRDIGGVALAEDQDGGVGGEPGGEDRQRPHGRPPGWLEQVPAPVDHGLEGLVALGRVTWAAAQEAEAVLQAAGDLGHRQHPDPGRRQLHRQRQPVQLAAHLLDQPGGQVGAGAGRHGPLPEQLNGGGQAQLGQQVHRFRGQAQRRPAGGEDP
jgi:hypothetical protein